MPDTVNDLLTARAGQRHGARRAVAIFLAVALHGGLAATAAFAPDWFAEEPLPVRYVPVELMPAPAVSRPEVRPEPERPEPESVPEPEPEPEEPPVVSPDAVQKPAEEPREEPPDAPRSRPGPELGVVGAGVTLDNPNFTYGYYVDRMVALIRSHWRRPALGGNVEAVVSFRIFEDGRVSAIKIARSSGYNRYDLAALRAVQSAAPLPPLPRSYQEPSLGVHLIFR